MTRYRKSEKIDLTQEKQIQSKLWIQPTFLSSWGTIADANFGVLNLVYQNLKLFILT